VSSATGRGSREPSGRPAPRSARRRARRRPAAILGASRAVATLPVPLAWRCANVREREGSGKSGVGEGEGGAGAVVGGGEAWACREGGGWCQSARGFERPPRRRCLPLRTVAWLSRGVVSGLTSSTRSIGLVPGVRGDVGLGRRPGRCGGRGEGGEFGGRLRATGRLKGRPAVVCAPSLLVPGRASPQRPTRSAPTSPSANVRTALLLNLKNLC